MTNRSSSNPDISDRLVLTKLVSTMYKFLASVLVLFWGLILIGNIIMYIEEYYVNWHQHTIRQCICISQACLELIDLLGTVFIIIKSRDFESNELYHCKHKALGNHKFNQPFNLDVHTRWFSVSNTRQYAFNSDDSIECFVKCELHTGITMLPWQRAFGCFDTQRHLLAVMYTNFGESRETGFICAEFGVPVCLLTLLHACRQIVMITLLYYYNLLYDEHNIVIYKINVYLTIRYCHKFDNGDTTYSVSSVEQKLLCLTLQVYFVCVCWRTAQHYIYIYVYFCTNQYIYCIKVFKLCSNNIHSKWEICVNCIYEWYKLYSKQEQCSYLGVFNLTWSKNVIVQEYNCYLIDFNHARSE